MEAFVRLTVVQVFLLSSSFVFSQPIEMTQDLDYSIGVVSVDDMQELSGFQIALLTDCTGKKVDSIIQILLDTLPESGFDPIPSLRATAEGKQLLSFLDEEKATKKIDQDLIRCRERLIRYRDSKNRKKLLKSNVSLVSEVYKLFFQYKVSPYGELWFSEHMYSFSRSFFNLFRENEGFYWEDIFSESLFSPYLFHPEITDYYFSEVSDCKWLLEYSQSKLDDVDHHLRRELLLFQAMLTAQVEENQVVYVLFR